MEFKIGKLAFQGILRNIVFMYAHHTALDVFTAYGSPRASISYNIRITHTYRAQTCLFEWNNDRKKILQSHILWFFSSENNFFV